MKKNEKNYEITLAKNGIWGIFPTLEAFNEFHEEIKNTKIPDGQKNPIKGILHWAKKEGLIKSESIKDFERFLKRNKSIITATKPPVGYTFADFLKEIGKISRLSVKQIVEDIEKSTVELGIGSTDTVTISRLKQDDPFKNNTVSKRRALRLLSFWVCRQHSELGWNYELLFELCTSTKQVLEVNEKEGVRVAFHLEAIEGEAIESDEIEWLNIEVASCIDDLKLGHLTRFKKNITSSATAAFLNIPREKGVLEPRYFAQAIRDAVCLAHQISIRWSLSEYSSTSKNIKIAIVAGNFQEKDIEGNLDLHIQALLDAKLPNDSVIRVCDFAYLCARVADIKVIFYDNPIEIEYFNRSRIIVWSIKAFWTFQYYDFIPSLTRKDMTPVDQISHNEFRESIYLANDEKFKSLEAINKFPRNTILILEVAKVLVAKRHFNEAYTIISRALTVDPLNTICRTYRMMVLLNLALRNYGTPVADLFFKRAVDEGSYIEKNCNITDEEFFNEYGLVFYAQALTKFNTYRYSVNYEYNKDDKEEIIDLINQAEDYFMKGSIVSASGIGYSAVYYLLIARSFRLILELDNKGDLFLCPDDENREIRDYDNIYGKVGIELFFYMGWIDRDPGDQDILNCELTAYQYKIFKERFFNAVGVYDNTVLSRIYTPDIKYAYATVIFDFFPCLTVGLVKEVLVYLGEAIELANNVNEGIYSLASISNWYSQIQGSKEFIECVQRAIDKIKQKIGDDLETKKDDYIIEYSKLDGLKLTLLNIGNVVDGGYIYYD